MQEWAADLKAAGQAPSTIAAATDFCSVFAGWWGKDLLTVSGDDFRTFLNERRDGGLSPSTLQTYHRHVRNLFKYLVRQGELAGNPLDAVKQPIVPEKMIPLVGIDELNKVLSSCSSRSLEDRRDKAFLLLLMDTGLRLSELTDAAIEDVDVDQGVMLVLRKGRKMAYIPFTEPSKVALTRYLRQRGNPKAGPLWVSRKGGKLSSSGAAQMLRKRGNKVGVDGFRAHRVRHTVVDAMLASPDYKPIDVQMLMGWKSADMLQRYGAAGAGDRAKKVFRKQGGGLGALRNKEAS